MVKRNELVLEVMQEKCDECLFTDKRIVRKGRMADIIKECRKKKAYFICHKASIKGSRKCMCRGFFDTQNTQLIQIAQKLELVRFVEEKDI